MRSNRGVIWCCLFIMCVLAGCGSSTGDANSGNTNAGANSTPTATPGPDRVQIQIFEVDQKTASKTVTVSQADLVQQFYQITNGLPAYPKDAMCTQEMGPRYILTFSGGGAAVTAERYGCKKVMIGNDMRQGTQQFWQELDQMIAKGV